LNYQQHSGQDKMDSITASNNSTASTPKLVTPMQQYDLSVDYYDCYDK
jgi:hypothetical protein